MPVIMVGVSLESLSIIIMRFNHSTLFLLALVTTLKFISESLLSNIVAALPLNTSLDLKNR